MPALRAQRPTMSRKDAMAVEAIEIAEKHRRLKAEMYARMRALSTAGTRTETTTEIGGRPTCKRGHLRINENLVSRPDGSLECARCRDIRREQRNSERRHRALERGARLD